MAQKYLDGGFRRQCETASVEWRRTLGLRAFDPLDADLLASHLEVTVAVPSQCSALTVEQARAMESSLDWWGGLISVCPALILLHPRQSPARRESTLMHEMSHFLLEHGAGRLDSHTGQWMHNPCQEEEATHLGSCLQVPRRGLVWARQKRMTVTQASAHFGASEPMIEFRMNLTGVRLPRYNEA